MAIIQVWQRGERVKRRVRDGRDSTGAAGALRPHKHAAAPGRARASVKDILEVSYSCNELLGPAPRHRCDHLLSSILGQPAPETGDSKSPLASTSHGVKRTTPNASLCVQAW
ncbi:hypothetical protein J1605_009755 [Eschrichtius robustus]|uniref:Uncharacterized protein n=1 Tax=Eschrichtius robustus TaxID=9764 RepID=A0AB34GVG5_ESCRO|nr:hypothetical protein J1605_009755 [Eschrichtius robustus]